MGNRRKQAAFTLIELLVVVIIVAVLAAVGIPLLTGNIQRARASEAEAGLGTWRTGIRAYLAQQGGNFPTGTPVTLAQAGFLATDFSGRWFDSAAYNNTVTNGTANYCIGVSGAATGVPAARAVQVQAPNLITRCINQDGSITDGACTAAVCGGNPLN